MYRLVRVGTPMEGSHMYRLVKVGTPMEGSHMYRLVRVGTPMEGRGHVCVLGVMYMCVRDRVYVC
jgi:hypothetical protein